MRRRNSASPPPSSSASGHLPSSAITVLNVDDLLTEILVWLPVRSILKFKSVSKRWLALISNPSFVPRRHSKAISGLCFRLIQQEGPKPKYGFINLSKSLNSRPPFKTLDFARDPFGVRILNSCNGLIVCSSDNDNDSRGKKRLYVYNPTTNRSTTLPNLTPQPLAIWASLAFDPSKSPHYKVICVLVISRVSHSDEYHCKLVIYSSENRDWKSCGDPFDARDVDFEAGVFWNRSVHWPSRSGDSSLRFDVEKEQLRDLPMPPVLITEPEPVRSRYRWLGQLGDQLIFVEIRQPNPLQFEVFQVKPDYSGWFVRYEVDLGPVMMAFPEMVMGYSSNLFRILSGMFTMVGLFREEDDDDESYMLLLLSRYQMAVQYKLKDGSFSKICDSDPDNCAVTFVFHTISKALSLFVYPFIESLAAV